MGLQSDPRQATGTRALYREPVMNTLQLIKTRTKRRQAVERARLQMTRDFANGEHTDSLHTPVGRESRRTLCYRGVPYEPARDQQQATAGLELRYRGIRYGVY